MELSEQVKRDCIKRLLLSRMRILNNHGFFGLLLMHMVFSLTLECDTACTDGVRISFNPTFLQELTDSELDFVLMHEILHVVLQHCLRDGDRQPQRFNIACDIVVNSIILQENDMDLHSITLGKWGQSMHLAPDGKEGYMYTAEQVYDMLQPVPEKPQGKKPGGFEQGRAKKQKGRINPGSFWDDHTKWGTIEDDDKLRDVWVKQLDETCEAIKIRDLSNTRGLLPAFAKRLLDELKAPQTDWREILNAFVQLQINDYSFSPPDRRYQDGPFFLPDFNEWGECDKVNDILFMIDTSASVSDEMIVAAYSEVKGAIDQYGGQLKGWLGFFDAAIIKPVPFESVEELLAIRPAGGGGTDFQIIFEYVHQYMADTPPACIIILTDGYAPFPQEKLAKGIPVLWLLNNDKVDPPWGKVARTELVFNKTYVEKERNLL